MSYWKTFAMAINFSVALVAMKEYTAHEGLYANLMAGVCGAALFFLHKWLHLDTADKAT